MKIHIYESQTAPVPRRFSAHIESIPESIYLVIYGPSAEIAKAKAQLHLAYRELPPDERKAFDLKGQLDALNSGSVEVLTDDDEDDLL